ncbi:MAG: hypothetical protein DRP80_07485 [Candidatus Omnitrophota bacterium]|nr:MAG: hypothetical protein DRP80_07485 [Candidatus Omnitrophota bacterium]
MLNQKILALKRENEECKEKLEEIGITKKEYKSDKDLFQIRKIALYRRILSYVQDKEFDKAIKECKKVLEINPQDKDAHFNLGFLYSLKKDFKRAVKEYKKVLAIDPHDKEVYYNLAIIYHQNLKDEKKARYYYEKFLKEIGK